MKPEFRDSARRAGNLGRPGKKRSSWLLISASLLLAPLLGATLGVQPQLLLPLAALATAAAVFGGGVALARRVMPDSTGWQPYALITFWILVINLPALLPFDQTGFTQTFGLFNAQSLSRILLFTGAAVLALVCWVGWSRDRSRLRRGVDSVAAAPLFALYLWYLVQAPIVSTGLPALLAIFRAFEWLVAFFLMFLLFRAQNVRDQTTVEDRMRIIMPMLYFLVGTSLLLLLVRPEAAYQRSALSGLGRLGGPFAHPNLLALAATLLFAYGLVFKRAATRVLLCVVGAAVVFFTYSRGGYVAFAVVLGIGALIGIRHAGARVVVLLALCAGLIVLSQVPAVVDQASKYLARGNESQGLSTLSERTAVWEAAKIMIARSPWLGEGFVSGPKELGALMIRERLSHNFAAPHAHNEVLQAQVSGGVIASLLSVGIHLRILYLLAWRKRLGRAQAFFLWSVFACAVGWGLLQPSLSYQLMLPGILVGWLLLTLEGAPGRERRAFGWPSRLTPTAAP